eukprot:TRINITY_DN35904_c1_g1_i1.p1 TRINITY_DN35904_c1_g1~~TRINITY_DN35904_c1_g1_i1.p1  ORF type:complete len:249 (+),score=41.76 TRINITY_DN35904_c1_g1_i1:91-837(+)
MNIEEDLGLNELEEEFQQAADFVAKSVTNNDSRFDDRIKLQLYGFYKVATVGKCEGSRPSIFFPGQRAKWDAWNALGDMGSNEAMQQYIQTLDSVAVDWRTSCQEKKGVGFGSSFGLGVSTLNHTQDEIEDEDIVQESLLVRQIRVEGDLHGMSDNEIKSMINVADEQGATPLHWAVDQNLLQVVEKLVQLGCSLDLGDNEGSTPLHYAALCEFREIFDFLISKGAQVNALNDVGESPKMLAPQKWEV